MVNKKIVLLLLILISLFAVISCDKTYVTKGSDNDDNDSTGYSGINEDDDDYTGTDNDTVFIVFKGTSVTSTNKEKAEISNTVVTVNSGGTYCISGTVSNGQLIVNSSDHEDVRLVLKGASITCSSSSPIYVKDAEKVIIVTVAGTTSYMTDGTSYTYDDIENQEPDACIFSKSDLTFYGTGSLYVKGNFNNGITSKDGLIIKSGTINVTSANAGIKGKDYLLVYDGTVTVTSTADGLKSTNSTDSGAGFIQIKGGTFNITSGGDGLSAYSDIAIYYVTQLTIKAGGGSGTSTITQGYTGTTSAKGLKAGSSVEIEDGNISINSADDGIHTSGTTTIAGGTIGISTMDDAIHAETSHLISGGTITITKCYEGLEGPSINISGGTISIASTDDAINGTKGSATEYDDGSLVTISGGTIILNPSSGDGLDSNGGAIMTGGILVAQGPASNPEVALDINGTFNMNGGILLASGPNSGNMIEGPATSSSQNCLEINVSSSGQSTPGNPGSSSSTTFAASSLINIQDSNGAEVATYKFVRSSYYFIFSSSSLVAGSTYSIYTGGTTTGTSYGGYYVGGSYTGGTLKKSFTVSSSSKINNVSF
jgi:hypothetical protein